MKPKRNAKEQEKEASSRGEKPKSAKDKQFDAIVDEILREHADVLRRFSER